MKPELLSKPLAVDDEESEPDTELQAALARARRLRQAELAGMHYKVRQLHYYYNEPCLCICLSNFHLRIHCIHHQFIAITKELSDGYHSIKSGYLGADAVADTI